MTQRLRNSQLFRASSWSFMLKFAAAGLGFLVSVVLARNLGTSGYGIYAFALALATTLSLPAQIGLPLLLVRETARGHALEEPELVRGVWVWAGRVASVLSLLIALGGAGVLLVLNPEGFDQEASTLLWAFLLVPLVALGNLRGAALRGLDKVVIGQLPEFIFRPFFLLLLAGGTVILTGTLNPPGAMALHVVAAALAFVGGAWLLWRHTPHSIRQALRRFEWRSWIASAWPLALIAGIVTINSQVDILMLGWFESADQVGIYKVAVNLSIAAAYGIESVNLVVAPRIARLYALNDLSALQRLVTNSARIVMVLNAAVTLGILVLGQFVIRFAYGDAFLPAFGPLVILLVGQFINSATGSAGQLLNMTGNERSSARAFAVAAGTNIALNVVLIPRIGIYGAAIATAFSISAQNLMLWLAARRRIGIDSTAFGLKIKEKA